MLSIQASSYPVSALAQNFLPPQATDTKPPSGSDSKSSATKADTALVSGPVRSVSDRVSAFLATDQAEKPGGAHPNRPPPPPNADPPPQGKPAGGGEMVDKSEIALILLETEETEDDNVDSLGDTSAQTVSILFDDAETYQPSSLY